MPVVLRHGPYRFHFYSVDRNEPMHVHVVRDDAECKYWLDPVRYADNDGFSMKELNRIEKIIISHRKQLVEQWNEYFNN